MNTPAHLILGAAAFARAGSSRVTAAALAGGFLPDLSLYLLAGWHLLVLGTPGNVVFGVHYYSDAWQQIFAIDNSFVFWGIGLGAAIALRVPWAIAFAGAGMLHLVLDFPLHTHDARMHFWPLTDWKFISPVSYWEGARGGDIVGWVEFSIVIGATFALFWRFRHSLWRWVFVAIAALQVAPFFVWRLVF